MSFLRYGAIGGVALTALAGTVYLEQNTGLIDNFHDSVGVEEYSLTDAREYVSDIGGGSTIAMMAITSLDTMVLESYLPTEIDGWTSQQVNPDFDYIKRYSRELALGVRPSADQLWPLGALSVAQDGKLAIDMDLLEARDLAERDVAAHRYSNALSDVLVSLEDLPAQEVVNLRAADEAVLIHLGRETVTIAGNEFMLLTSHESPYTLLRAYIGDSHVVEIRGTAFVSEIEEILEQMPLDMLGENAKTLSDLQSL